jgi:DNA/RNA non-specific endonuclease
MAVIGATSSATAAAKSAPPTPQTPAEVANILVTRNTNKIGHVDTKALVQDIKRVNSDPKVQRKIATESVHLLENRKDQNAFVKELKREGVAKKPGFFEQRRQEIVGLAEGIGGGAKSLVVGLYDAGKEGVKLTGKAIETTYNYATDDEFRDKTNKKIGDAASTVVRVTGNGLQSAKNYVEDRVGNPGKLLKDVKTIESAIETGTNFVTEKADEFHTYINTKSSEADINGESGKWAGKIVGRGAFEAGSLFVPVTKLGVIAKGAKAIEAADVAVDAVKVVKGVEVLADAGKLAKGAEVVADTSKAVKSAEVIADAGKTTKGVETAAKTGKAVNAGEKATSKLVKGADEALKTTGDTARRIEQVEKEAKLASEAAAEVTKVLERTATVGKNEAVWTLNEAGQPTSVTAKLREVFSGASRSSAEATAQREAGGAARLIDDEGGHILGHRFMKDQGLDNLIAQNGNLNKSAYKKLENELADWVKAGGEVDLKVTLKGGVPGRPDQIFVEYKVLNPKTGKVVFDNVDKFNNVANETFARVSKSEIATKLK